MFHLEYVRARNCLLFEEVAYRLSGQGVVLVTGENRSEYQTQDSSNAAGKSALFELIPMLLFDRATRGSTKDAWTLNPEKPMYLEVGFSVNGDRYQVTLERHRLRTKMTVLKNGEDVTPRGGVPQARRYLADVLPLDEESYYSIVHLTPSRASQFIEGSPQARYTYMANLLGLDNLDFMKQRIERELAETRSISLLPAEEYKADIRRLQKEMIEPPSGAATQRLLRKVQAAVYGLRQEARRLTSLQDALKRFQRYEEPPKVSKRVLNALEDRLRRLEVILSDARLYRDKSVKLAELCRAHPQLYGKKRQALERELTHVMDYLDYLNVYREAKRALDQLGLDEKVDERVFAALDTQASMLSARMGNLSARLDILREEIKKLESLKDKARCPLCGEKLQPKKIAHLLEEKRQLVEKYEQQYEQSRAEHRKVQELRSLQRSYYRVRETLARIPTYCLNYFQRHMDLDALKASLEKQKELLNRALYYHEILDQLRKPPLPYHKLEEVTERLRARLEQLRRAYHRRQNYLALRRGLLEQGWRGESPAQLARRLRSLETRLKVLENLERRLRETLVLLQERRNQYRKQQVHLEELRRLYRKAKWRDEKLRVLSFLQKAFAAKGLKKRIVNHYLKNMIRKLNEYASYLFKNTRFKLRTEKNKLSIVYSTPSREGDIRYMSTGQKRRLALAILPALTSILPPMRKCNVVILDEVDANVDRVGVKAMNEFLPVLKEKFSSIFVITPHRRHFTNYDAHWHVVRGEDGVSHLTINRR